MMEDNGGIICLLDFLEFVNSFLAQLVSLRGCEEMIYCWLLYYSEF